MRLLVDVVTRRAAAARGREEMALDLLEGRGDPVARRGAAGHGADEPEPVLVAHAAGAGDRGAQDLPPAPPPGSPGRQADREIDVHPHLAGADVHVRRLEREREHVQLVLQILEVEVVARVRVRLLVLDDIVLERSGRAPGKRRVGHVEADLDAEMADAGGGIVVAGGIVVLAADGARLRGRHVGRRPAELREAVGRAAARPRASEPAAVPATSTTSESAAAVRIT